MGEIIQLHVEPTQAQTDRAIECARAILESPTRSDDRSLCQDIARLIFQIDAAALLAGAMRPSVVSDGKASQETADDEIFLKLYQGASQLLLKVANIPQAQSLSYRKHRRRRH